MKSLPFLFFLFLFHFSFSQKNKEYLLVDSLNYDSLSMADKSALDSLLPLYHRAKHDTERLRILSILPEYTNDENVWPRYNHLLYESVEKHLKNTSSLNAAEIKIYKKCMGQALQNLGYEEQFLKGNMDKAKEYYEKALSLQKVAGDKSGAATTLGNIGLIYNDQGDIITSLEYFLRSLKIQEEINDKNGMGYSLNNAAGAYLLQGDTAKALEYMEKSLKYREETGDKRGYAITLGNIGNLYRRKQKTDTSVKCYFEALDIWKELGEKQGIGFCYQNIGNLYYLEAKQKRENGVMGADSMYEAAMTYLQYALNAYEASNFKQGLTNVLTNIGNCYLEKNNISGAENSGKRAYAEAEKMGYVEAVGNAARLLFNVYKKQNKWKEAFTMHEMYTQMRDSIFNEETQKATFKQQTKYEYEKQQALNDAENQKELAVAGEGKKRQQIMTWSIAIGLFLAAIFSLIVFNRLRITRKQKLLIEKQKKIVDQKNKHITDSINYAKRIQDSILPSEEEFIKSFSDHFIFFQPRDIVSGDFYWMSSFNGKTILACADCTGHGVPGAFMSMIGNTLLNEIVNEKGVFQPAEILQHLNEGIVHALHQDAGSSQDDGMDISVCSFDKTNNKFAFAGANRSCFIAADDYIEEIKGDIFSIGGAFGKRDVSFSQKEIEVKKNASMFLFTDGYADQPGGEKRKKFQEKNLQELLASIQEKPMKEQREILNKKITDWKAGHSQLDDMLVMGIKL